MKLVRKQEALLSKLSKETGAGVHRGPKWVPRLVQGLLRVLRLRPAQVTSPSTHVEAAIAHVQRRKWKLLNRHSGVRLPVH
jgi:hypothetical protein